MIIIHFIKKILVFLLIGLRPFLGVATCRFPIGCTAYAQEQLEKQPLHQALWLICKRLLLCNPFW